MLVIFFGLAGAGKNYVGQLMSRNTHLHFWDADEALTDEMRVCIEQKRSFTQDMLDRYFNIVIENIKRLTKKHGDLIVTQAFYRNKNRQLILTTFPDTLFIQVQVQTNILMARLRKRNNHVTEAYAKQIIAEFEEPNHLYSRIDNNIEHGHDTLIAQLKRIPGLEGTILS